MSVTSRDTGFAKRAPDRGRMNAEVLTEFGEGPAFFVELAGFVEVLEDEVAASWKTGATDVFHDGGACNTEVVGYPIDRGATAVVGE